YGVELPANIGRRLGHGRRQRRRRRRRLGQPTVTGGCEGIAEALKSCERSVSGSTKLDCLQLHPANPVRRPPVNRANRELVWPAVDPPRPRRDAVWQLADGEYLLEP